MSKVPLGIVRFLSIKLIRFAKLIELRAVGLAV